MKVLVKRIYESAAESDGFRLLVDRLWPRGLSKEAAHIDLWLPDVGPSTALRQWFGHDRTRWAEFRRRYHAELEAKRAFLAVIKERANGRPITLLYSAKDERYNQAVALRSFLVNRTLRANPLRARRSRQSVVQTGGS